MPSIADYFKRICELIALKNSSGFGFSSPEAQELDAALNGFRIALEGLHIFPADWVSRHSIGKGNLASVMWVVFLPPHQSTQDGIYVSFCFGRAGNGLVTGCAISNTSQKKYSSFVQTQKRSHPRVDVDGTRPGTHYNNGFVNPKEFLVEDFSEDLLVTHVQESIPLCEKSLREYSRQNEKSNLEDFFVTMSDSSKERYALWKSFREKWPKDHLQEMSLDQYTSFGASDSFCNWIESRTQSLGSIWGGSSYKFGVFKQNPDTAQIEDSTHVGDGIYKWYRCYGQSAAEVFGYVKDVLTKVSTWSAAGNFNAIDSLKFGHAMIWKVAFLYQDMEHPSLLPIYNKKMLSRLSGLGMKVPTSEMQRKLMSEKPQGQDLFAYYEDLLKRLPENAEKKAADDDEQEVLAEESVHCEVRTIGELSKDDLDDFIRFLREDAKLTYRDDFVRRFLAALQAKNFVVLTGLSGSGKTQLAIAFCKWMTEPRREIQYNPHAKLVAVGADWTNNEKMLGYPNALEPGKYVRPESGVLDLVLQAAKDQEHPYVLVLDEMNLSHVERYFADFLSAMESGGDLKLHGGTEDLDGVPPTVKMPANLWVIGTMNVDETTYMFSPKVLDRAQVLEFRVKADDMKQFLEEKQAGAAAALNAFFPELAKVGSEFGYRTAAEFCSFVERAIALGSGLEDAVDAAIMQKLLPKLHGSRRQLEKPLEALWRQCLKENVAASVETLAKAEGEINVFPYQNNCRYPLSAEKIARIFKNAKNNGFASFAEA